MRLRATRLSAISNVLRSAFKIASVNPVLWWDAESHRLALSGGVATLFQDSGGTSAVTTVEQPVGRATDRSGNGRHALQATSTARPLLTARKNLLTYSEQFDNAVWVKPAGVSVTSNVSSAPDGATTADSVTFSNTSGYLYSSISSTHSAGSAFTWSLYIRTATRAITWGGATPSGTDIFSVVDVGGGWYRQSLTRTFTNASTGAVVQAMLLATLPAGLGPHIVWGAQLESGTVATKYQRIASATEYDAVTGSLMMRFDGLDDGVGVSLSAGVLPANADVYVVVRRAPGDGNSVILYGSSTNYIGMLESGSSSRPDSNVGFPAYTVNGSSVAWTRTALNSAIPEGSLRLLEVRGADLSAWTAATLGQFVNYRFLGGIGAVLIVPARSDSTRSKIRKALAKAYQIQGVV